MRVRELEDIQKDLENAEMELIKQQTKVNGLQLEKNAKRLNDIEKLLPKAKRIKTRIDKTFFDEWEYKKVVMWCKKKEYAEEFCRLMHEQGMKWKSGSSCKNLTFWGIFKEDTVYEFGKKVFYEDITKYEEDGYIIIDFEDYITKEEKEKMSKKELAEFLVDNFTDEDGCLDLSGLDFSEYNCHIDIRHMKVSKSLFQSNQEVQRGSF